MVLEEEAITETDAGATHRLLPRKTVLRMVTMLNRPLQPPPTAVTLLRPLRVLVMSRTALSCSRTRQDFIGPRNVAMMLWSRRSACRNPWLRCFWSLACLGSQAREGSSGHRKRRATLDRVPIVRTIGRSNLGRWFQRARRLILCLWVYEVEEISR